MNPNTDTGETLSVCFAISGLNTGGGIERHVRDLADGLVNADCSLTILAHESFKTLFDDSVDFRTVRFDRWRYSPFLLREFTQQVRALNPSIVHAHGRKAAQVVSLTRKKFQSKCILTVHNLNVKPHLFENFDTVIAVSPAVARKIDHPYVQTILNGCS